jgi:hypothetical protein
MGAAIMNSVATQSFPALSLLADDIWSVSFDESDTAEQFTTKLESIEDLIQRHTPGAFRRLNLVLDFSGGGAFTSDHRRELLSLLGSMQSA